MNSWEEFLGEAYDEAGDAIDGYEDILFSYWQLGAGGEEPIISANTLGMLLKVGHLENYFLVKIDDVTPVEDLFFKLIHDDTWVMPYDAGDPPELYFRRYKVVGYRTALEFGDLGATIGSQFLMPVFGDVFRTGEAILVTYLGPAFCGRT